ncbi:hypothetical protein ACEPAI_7691 [Sanghuangporus weigelae]
MVVGLPSFYFPLREGNGYPVSQSLLTTSDGRNYSLSAVVSFFFFQIFGGQVGIPVILLTLYFSKGARKHPMLVNFLVTWIIYSVSFCILLYLGKQFGPEPNHVLCVTQASLIYGTAVMTPTAGLSFVLNLWLSLRAVTENKSVISNYALRNYALVAAPYGAFAVFVIFTASYGATTTVSRNRYLFYCTINSTIVDLVPGIAAMIMISIIVFEGLIAFKLYRMHKAFVSMRLNGGPPLHLIIRVGIFSVYSFMSIVACIGFWSKAGAELPYIIQASLPTAAFIIFGTQPDLLEVWGIIRFLRFIRRKPKPVQVIEIPKPRPFLEP